MLIIALRTQPVDKPRHGLPVRVRVATDGQKGHPVHHTHVKAVLPRLRRHALFLTGNATVADRAVMCCLHAYRAQPERVRTATARLDLFRLFHMQTAPATQAVPAVAAHAEAWSGAPQTPELSAISRPARPTFGGLAADQRSVLALVAVEGFSIAESAGVLNISTARASRLLRDARAQLAAVY